MAPLSRSKLTRKHPSLLLADEWEIRLSDDVRPWYYETRDVWPKGCKHRVIFSLPNGQKTIYYDTRMFRRDLKLWNVGCGLPSLVEKARELYPEATIDTEQRYIVESIQILHVDSGHVEEVGSVKAARRLTGCGNNAVLSSIESGGRKLVRNFAFRKSSVDDWPSDTYTVEQSKCISTVNVETGETVNYRSINEAARALGVDKKVISNRIGTPKTIHNWRIIEKSLANNTESYPSVMVD